MEAEEQRVGVFNQLLLDIRAENLKDWCPLVAARSVANKAAGPDQDPDHSKGPNGTQNLRNSSSLLPSSAAVLRLGVRVLANELALGRLSASSSRAMQMA